MLTIDDFEKIDISKSQRAGEILMVPKAPIAGLEGLEITISSQVFAPLTSDKQEETIRWSWQWRSGENRDSSMSQRGGKPSPQFYPTPGSAAEDAIKSASYWSDEERLARDEQKRQQLQRRRERLDNQIDRFLNS